ncbi:hypothetical protein GCM10020001_108720 [Nonomuraea salmonea]
MGAALIGSALIGSVLMRAVMAAVAALRRSRREVRLLRGALPSEPVRIRALPMRALVPSLGIVRAGARPIMGLALRRTHVVIGGRWSG